MTAIVIESSKNLKLAIVKRIKKWTESSTGRRIRVELPVSDRIKPTYTTKMRDILVAGKKSVTKDYTIVFMESHFEGKEYEDENGESKPFTFDEGLEILFKDPTLLKAISDRTAGLKVGNSNKQLIARLLKDGIIQVNWIANKEEFLQMQNGGIDEQFIKSLGVPKPPSVEPAGETVIESKAIQDFKQKEAEPKPKKDTKTK